MPVSSKISRLAVSASISPGSTLPLGSVTSRYFVRWMSSTRIFSSTMRHRTPPAA